MLEAAMTDESRLSLIPAFYLSKFDKGAVSALGYQTFREAFADIGGKLSENPSSIKNKRDDFDPIFENRRAGWHQRALGPSRLKTLLLFDGLSFEALTTFVQDLLNDFEYRKSSEVVDVLKAMKGSRSRAKAFSPRGPTGRLAEELFLKWFENGLTPFAGIIHDRRDDGCGYDFLIQEKAGEQLVEVKGLAEKKGSILFTDKEWQTASGNPLYNLAVFSDLRKNPKLKIYKSVSEILEPKQRVNIVVQVSWQVSGSQLLAKGNR